MCKALAYPNMPIVLSNVRMAYLDTRVEHDPAVWVCATVSPSLPSLPISLDVATIGSIAHGSNVRGQQRTVGVDLIDHIESVLVSPEWDQELVEIPMTSIRHIKKLV